MTIRIVLLLISRKGFPCGLAGKESACNEGDLCSISGFGKSPGEGKGYPLQYSGCGLGSPEFHGLGSPWGHKELDTSERLSLHFISRKTESEGF